MIAVPPAIRAVPAVAFTLLLAAVSMQSFELSSLLTINMLLLLHPLYFWGMYRPQIFPVWLVFLLGFLIDLISGRLLGLNAFLLVFIQQLIMRQQRYLLSQPFATQWAAIMVAALAAEMARWVVMIAVTMTFFSPASALTSAVCSAALYPITALVMQMCLRLISPDRHHSGLEG
ncbi:MAG: rod shape-determining protein MreD [Alphaproteobacteria bacterium]|nr:rod shape-determining protein MreD [Alphaproteobacteria bacterium]